MKGDPTLAEGEEEALHASFVAVEHDHRAEETLPLPPQGEASPSSSDPLYEYTAQQHRRSSDFPAISGLRDATTPDGLSGTVSVLQPSPPIVVAAVETPPPSRSGARSALKATGDDNAAEALLASMRKARAEIETATSSSSSLPSPLRTFTSSSESLLPVKTKDMDAFWSAIATPIRETKRGGDALLRKDESRELFPGSQSWEDGEAEEQEEQDVVSAGRRERREGGGDDDEEGGVDTAEERNTKPPATTRPRDTMSRHHAGLIGQLRTHHRDRAAVLHSMRHTLDQLRHMQPPPHASPTSNASTSHTEVAALRQRCEELTEALEFERKERARFASSASNDLASIELLFQRGVERGGGASNGAAGADTSAGGGEGSTFAAAAMDDRAAAWQRRALAAEKALLMIRTHESFAAQLSEGDANAQREHYETSHHTLREALDTARREVIFEREAVKRVRGVASAAAVQRDHALAQLSGADSAVAAADARVRDLHSELEAEKRVRRRLERAQTHTATAFENRRSAALEEAVRERTATLTRAAAVEVEANATRARQAEMALRKDFAATLAAARADAVRDGAQMNEQSEELVAAARRSCEAEKKAYSEAEANAKRMVVAARAAEDDAVAQLRTLIQQYDALLAAHTALGEEKTKAMRALFGAQTVAAQSQANAVLARKEAMLAEEAALTDAAAATSKVQIAFAEVATLRVELESLRIASVDGHVHDESARLEEAARMQSELRTVQMEATMNERRVETLSNALDAERVQFSAQDDASARKVNDCEQALAEAKEQLDVALVTNTRLADDVERHREATARAEEALASTTLRNAANIEVASIQTSSETNSALERSRMECAMQSLHASELRAELVSSHQQLAASTTLAETAKRELLDLQRVKASATVSNEAAVLRRESAMRSELNAAESALALARAHSDAQASQAELERGPSEQSVAALEQKFAVEIASQRGAVARKEAECAELVTRLDATALELEHATASTQAMAAAKTLAFEKLKEVVGKLRHVQTSESATTEVLERERRAHRTEVAALQAAKDEAFTSLRRVLARVKKDEEGGGGAGGRGKSSKPTGRGRSSGK